MADRVFTRFDFAEELDRDLKRVVLSVEDPDVLRWTNYFRQVWPVSRFRGNAKADGTMSGTNRG